MPEIEGRKKSKNGKNKSEPRCSTTDPDSCVMKMADGGFRPAFNRKTPVEPGTKSACHPEEPFDSLRSLRTGSATKDLQMRRCEIKHLRILRS